MADRARVGWGFLVFGIAIILIFTLWPFAFRPNISMDFWSRLAWRPSSFLDLPRNVLLFVPFGIGLSCLGTRPAAVLWLSFVLTATVETLQFFLPGRAPNLSDVAGNTLGGYIGMFGLRVWGRRDWWLNQFCATWQPTRVMAVSIAYAALAVILAGVLLAGFRVRGGDAFRFAFGNELTGDRPWTGSLKDVVLLDRHVSAGGAQQLMQATVPGRLQDSVVASYPLVNSFAPLGSPGAETPNIGNGGVELTPQAWLASLEPATEVAARINRTGEFTLALTASTTDLQQYGPARIVTFSRDSFRRNLTVGQVGTALAVRWRSLWTGTNGVTPELRFPNAFVAGEPTRIVLSLGDNRVTLYTTRAGAVSVLLGPELAAAAILMDGRWWKADVGSPGLLASTMALPILLYMPLGMISAFAKGSSAKARFASAFAVLCPPFVYELAVATWAQSSFRWAFFGLGVFLAGAGFCIARAARAFCLARSSTRA